MSLWRIKLCRLTDQIRQAVMNTPLCWCSAQAHCNHLSAVVSQSLVLSLVCYFHRSSTTVHCFTVYNASAHARYWCSNSVRPSDCPSVCLSRCGTVLKQPNIVLLPSTHRSLIILVFAVLNIFTKIRRCHPLRTAALIQIFCQITSVTNVSYPW